MRPVDERLHLDEHRPRALARHERDAAGDRRAVPRQENRGRILDLAKAFLAHDEEAHLVRGAEAILDGAHDAEAAADVALEVEHRVDHVLEHARTRERAFLRNVTDQQRRNVARLREPRELRGALAHLAHGARRRLQLFAEQRLDRVDREHAELIASSYAREHRLDARLGEHVERRFADAEALRSQADLLERLLARDVAGRHSRREIRERTQQQRRLADAGIAADQHDAAGHETAAEHAIELAKARRQALHRADVDAIETRELDLARVLRTLGTLRHGNGLGQRVPRAAIGALALPFRLLPAAIAAGINRSRLRHAARIAELRRRTAKPVAHHTGPRSSRAILRAAEGTHTMDRVRNQARKLFKAVALATSALFSLRRAKSQATTHSSDHDLLERARRATDGGRLQEAWALYRQLPSSPALFPEIYDLARALAAHDALDEAADLFHRIAQVDGEFRDVAQRLVRADHAPTEDDERARMPPSIGRYQLLEPIGRGAMGNVYLGRDPLINRILALKAIDLTIGFDHAELENTADGFLREATIAGSLSHPNIVTIFDVGQTDGLAYIAMEYVRGHHLSEFAVADRLLPVDTVLDLVGRAADALDYAHRRNVVHRDIKPANIMYDSLSNNVKITDFGIAKLIDANRTRTGIVLGTPAFMSPEQLEGKNVNGHTDLFALGVSLYQLLTGLLPFRGASMTNLMFVIANEPHQSVTSVRAGLPKWLDEVVDKALAKDPADRFQCAAEMAAALRRAA